MDKIEYLHESYEEYTSTVSTDAMAISYKTACFIFDLCEKYKFKTLMDRGSGFSSFVLRLYAKYQDFPVTVFSIDTSKEWLNKTRDYMKSKSLNYDNMLIWDDFYTMYKDKIKFDFILEDARKPLRVKTPDKLTSFIEEDGIILWDDAKVHSWIISEQAKKKGMNLYDTKEYTLDSYGRYDMLTTNRNLEEFKKVKL